MSVLNFLGFSSEKVLNSPKTTKFERFEGNPIITPRPDIPWSARATFNPAAIYLDNKVHLVYRAQDVEGTSTFGYAVSSDGFHLDTILDQPIYVPREAFEKKTKEHWNSGCEDPRITQIGERLIMTYVAYDGTNPPRVAMTSISVSDFLSQKWNWDMPKLISPPGVDDKDACILKKIKGEGYIAFHRLGNAMWLDSLRDLDFPTTKFLTGGIMAQARADSWDNIKIGIAAPPIETEYGWILLYHAVSNPGFIYKIGAMLLDYNDPRKILARTKEPLFSPEKDYELNGCVSNVVFSCGAVNINGTIFMYYGGADSVVGVATMPLSDLIAVLKSS